MLQPTQFWGSRIQLQRIRPQKTRKNMILVTEGPIGQYPQTDFWNALYPYSPNRGNYIFGNQETRRLDQNTSKECVIYSYLTSLESAYANHTGESKVLHFRAEYLLAKKFEHAIANLLEPYSQPLHFNLEGGELPHAIELVRRYGLVPEDIWRPLILADGSDGKNGWDFNAIYKTIKDETDIARNNLIYNPNYYAPKTIDDVKKDIFNKALKHYVGVMPKPFTYDGIEHTPQSFAQMYGQNPKTPIEVKFMHGSLPYPEKYKSDALAETLTRLTPNTTRPFFFRQPLKDVLDSIKNALADGKSINIDINGTIENFGHTLAVTDLEATPTGDVVAIKIKNTYRAPWGYGWYGGHVWISPHEFDKLVRRVWIVDIN